MKYIFGDDIYLLKMEDIFITYYGRDTFNTIQKDKYNIPQFTSNVFYITTYTNLLDISDAQSVYIPKEKIYSASATTDSFINELTKFKFVPHSNSWRLYLPNKSRFSFVEGVKILDIEKIIQISKCIDLEGHIIGVIHDHKFILIDVKGKLCEVNMNLLGKYQ